MSTLLSASKWLEEVLDANSTTDKPLLFLVGTKRDLLCDSAAQFVTAEAAKIANQLEAEFWPVSAQSGENVRELFARIASLTFNHIINKEIKTKRESAVSNVSGNSVKYAENFIKLSKKKDKRKSKDLSNCVKMKCFK